MQVALYHLCPPPPGTDLPLSAPCQGGLPSTQKCKDPARARCAGRPRDRDPETGDECEVMRTSPPVFAWTPQKAESEAGALDASKAG